MMDPCYSADHVSSFRLLRNKHRTLSTNSQQHIPVDTNSKQSCFIFHRGIKVNLPEQKIVPLCSERYSINTISKSLKKQFRESWENSIQTSSKLSFYRLCKTTFKKEAYLDLITNSKDRYNLTRLRISAHHLEIEKGRHINIPQKDKSCAWCELCLGLSIIENENNLLNDFDLYASNRKITTKKILANESQFMNHPSFPQITHL